MFAKEGIKPDYVCMLERDDFVSSCFDNDFKEFDKDITFIALTATASLSVLKDLKLAFGITNETNVKTPLSYARDELEFHVIDSTRKTQKVLIEKIKNIKALDENYATLIFTPYASQYDFGCIGVCNFLRKEMQNENIEFYSGKMDDTDKIIIQDSFKNNEFKFLVATKARVMPFLAISAIIFLYISLSLYSIILLSNIPHNEY